MSAGISFGKAPFVIEVGEKFTIVRLSGELDGNVLKEFEKKVPELSGDGKHILFQLAECTGMHQAWGRLFFILAAELKKNSKGIRFVAPSTDLVRLFSDRGLSNSFKFSATEVAAQRELEAAAVDTKKIDVKFVNAFLVATIEVMKARAQTDVVPGTPVLKNSQDPFTGDISGIIALASDAFNGAIIINFPEATFTGIISLMFSKKSEKVTSENSEGAAELTNIVFDHAKATLNEIGYGIKTATPSVSVGKNHQIPNSANGPRVSVPFTSELGSFTVEICLS